MADAESARAPTPIRVAGWWQTILGAVLALGTLSRLSRLTALATFVLGAGYVVGEIGLLAEKRWSYPSSIALGALVGFLTAVGAILLGDLRSAIGPETAMVFLVVFALFVVPLVVLLLGSSRRWFARQGSMRS